MFNVILKTFTINITAFSLVVCRDKKTNLQNVTNILETLVVTMYMNSSLFYAVIEQVQAVEKLYGNISSGYKTVYNI